MTSYHETDSDNNNCKEKTKLDQKKRQWALKKDRIRVSWTMWAHMKNNSYDCDNAENNTDDDVEFEDKEKVDLQYQRGQGPKVCGNAPKDKQDLEDCLQAGGHQQRQRPGHNRIWDVAFQHGIHVSEKGPCCCSKRQQITTKKPVVCFESSNKIKIQKISKNFV
ncbi:hypothetical protein RFI_31670 [Reticulomyxa filosa]|uniref:Uncharacterized protein n=1 Tax=Reticulomyxa filosa TaxID=46433 RepID=X6LYB4_RETFI|nr:hypothetical protein RFI_31670 [Reticulomyxa filosa]|eukprot:ETO05725.1 hypothetical protein RFI_31670 [Reticulomyxa filosa]